MIDGMPKVMNVKEALVYLGWTSAEYLRNRTRARIIVGYKRGGDWFYTEEDLRKYRETHPRSKPLIGGGLDDII